MIWTSATLLTLWYGDPLLSFILTDLSVSRLEGDREVFVAPAFQVGLESLLDNVPMLSRQLQRL